MSLLSDVRPGNLGPFSWEHEPERWEVLPGGGLRVYAFAGANLFQDPTGKKADDAAPFLWLPVEGDFVARLRTRPRFESTYDSGCLVVRQDATHWAKICYESTDFGTQAIVTVVTNGLSDDANGVDLAVADVWLQIARVGNVFALHYSLDGKDWHMVRLFRMDLPATVRVGMAAQCPVGPGSVMDFLAFDLDKRAVSNPRAGI